MYFIVEKKKKGNVFVIYEQLIHVLLPFALTLCHTITSFYQPRSKKPFKNIVGKGENAGYQHFLLFPQFFLHCDNYTVLHKIYDLQHLRFGQRLKLCFLVKVSTVGLSPFESCSGKSGFQAFPGFEPHFICHCCKREKHSGKGRKCWLPSSHFFSQCFCQGHYHFFLD